MKHDIITTTITTASDRPLVLSNTNEKFMTSTDQINKMISGIMEIIECAGLEEVQKEAMKSLIKRRIYSIEKIFPGEKFFNEHFGSRTEMRHSGERLLSNSELGLN